jgi:hypothetical protein
MTTIITATSTEPAVLYYSSNYEKPAQPFQTTTTLLKDKLATATLKATSAPLPAFRSILAVTASEKQQAFVSADNKKKKSVVKKVNETNPSATSRSTGAEPPSATTTSSAVAKGTIWSFWTPENKEGKKRYERELLLSLRSKKLSLIVPDVLDSLGILNATNQRKKQNALQQTSMVDVSVQHPPPKLQKRERKPLLIIDAYTNHLVDMTGLVTATDEGRTSK